MTIGAVDYSDVVSRVSQIQQQIEGLQTAFVLPSSTTGAAAGTATSAASAGGAAATTFSSALSTAMNGSALPATTSASATTGATTGATGTLPTGAATTGATTGATGTLPAGAATMLTSDQQQFASRLASDTGLDPGVVSAWLLAEESGGAATSRQSAGNNDWLNIGYTDGGTYGSGDSIWSDPVTAADATAGWLKGQSTIPGYGTASSGVQGILATSGQPPATQIAALQQSGWASSGYPDLPGLYQQVAG